MPREKEAYRDNLERLIEVFPNKDFLNIKDVCEFLGINYKTAKKRIAFKDGYVSKATLARQLS